MKWFLLLVFLIPMTGFAATLGDFTDTASELTALQPLVFSEDSAYLGDILSLIHAADDPELTSMFVANALVPYLTVLEIQIPSAQIDATLASLVTLDKDYHIDGLGSFKGIPLYQTLALQMLAASFRSDPRTMTDAEQSQAAELASLLTDVAAAWPSQSAVSRFQAAAPKLQALLNSLDTNLLLRAQSATDRCLFTFF
jgi:hypothetical protein